MIVDGSRSVCCPRGSIPIACFTDDVVPIAASFLSIDATRPGQCQFGPEHVQMAQRRRRASRSPASMPRAFAGGVLRFRVRVGR
jgi:hypothetical protein